MNAWDFWTMALPIALYTCLLFVALLVICAKGQAMLDAAIAWGRRTFTKAGDHPSCGCDRFHTEVFCVACRRVRVLTPTSTLTTADANVLLGDFDEARRRRDAFFAWEDCDETAVM